MKIEQKLDRALSRYLRLNATDWNPKMDANEREAKNKEVKEIIKATRAGEDSEWAEIVEVTDKARRPADMMRENSEKLMAALAMTLPVYPWIEAQRGAGALGLATVVAEAGDLGELSIPAHLWSRLGFAPYDGCAGSTWKRETWRPRTDRR